jgi:hypothetical protein
LCPHVAGSRFSSSGDCDDYMDALALARLLGRTSELIAALSAS